MQIITGLDPVRVDSCAVHALRLLSRPPWRSTTDAEQIPAFVQFLRSVGSLNLLGSVNVMANCMEDPVASPLSLVILPKHLVAHTRRSYSNAMTGYTHQTSKTSISRGSERSNGTLFSL